MSSGFGPGTFSGGQPQQQQQQGQGPAQQGQQGQMPAWAGDAPGAAMGQQWYDPTWPGFPAGVPLPPMYGNPWQFMQQMGPWNAMMAPQLPPSGPGQQMGQRPDGQMQLPSSTTQPQPSGMQMPRPPMSTQRTEQGAMGQRGDSQGQQLLGQGWSAHSDLPHAVPTGQISQMRDLRMPMKTLQQPPPPQQPVPLPPRRNRTPWTGESAGMYQMEAEEEWGGPGAIRTSASALRRRRRQRAEQSQRLQGGESYAGEKEDSMRGSRPPPLPMGSRRRDGSSMATESEAARCQKLMEDLEAGGERREGAVAQLRGNIKRMAGEPAGCRVVQVALQSADRQAAAQLCEELHGHVRELISSPHGNYVVQKVVEVMPGAVASFVPEELKGSGAQTARHRFGCRILCRLSEHAGSDPAAIELANEVLKEADDLCRHSFGHHVIQSILEHGQASQHKVIAAALCKDLERNAKNRSASYVIEKALTYCDDEDREKIVKQFLGYNLAELAQSQFGSYVVRALAKMSGEPGQLATAQLQQALGQIQASKHGQKILEDLQSGGHPESATARAAVAA